METNARITAAEALEIAIKAVEIYATQHPRPSQVTQEQACEMLGLSHVTVRKLIRAGTIKLNGCGKIAMSEIDRALVCRK